MLWSNCRSLHLLLKVGDLNYLDQRVTSLTRQSTVCLFLEVFQTLLNDILTWLVLYRIALELPSHHL